MDDIQEPEPAPGPVPAPDGRTTASEPGIAAGRGRARRGPGRRWGVLTAVALLAVVGLAVAALGVRAFLRERFLANPAADGWAFEVRPVLATGAPGTRLTAPDLSVGPTDPGDPAALEPQLTPELAAQAQALDCAKPPAAVPADHALVACTADGSAVYVLGPAGVTGSAITSVETDHSPRSSALLVTLTPAGDAALTAMTSRAVALPSPGNQVALVLDGRVLRAPAAVEPSMGGPLQIAADMPHAEVEAMAARISATRH